jgi:hypothetical protein
MSKRPFHVVLPLALGAAIACGAPAIVAARVQPAPQALDPLTSAEKATAEKLVRADQRARELLGENATLASIEFLAVKGREADEPMRHADLLFARQDSEFGARAIVRLGATPAIVEFMRVDRKSVPMTAADVQEVWKIALSDQGYRKRLTRDPGRLTPEALRIYTEDRTDSCFSGRCFYLIVRDGDAYVSNASVTVDLATRRILPDRSPR